MRADARAAGPAAVDYPALRFDYRRCAEQDAEAPTRHPVVVVGAGPVGLCLAIDLAQRGVRVVLLDGDDRLSAGSRAICFAQRTLQAFDRLGCGERMAAKGVSWSRGRVFAGDAQVYRFDLLPEAGHERPAFVNLQQYYVEGYLVERAAALPLIEIRWRHTVVAVEPRDDGVVLGVETPDGPYRLAGAYVAACDGSRSAVRALTGHESQGRVFRDRFLIADVKLPPGHTPRRAQADDAGEDGAAPPAERWFWFDPPFHPRQSVLLHRQPDDVWRIDFQLGWEADPEHEKRPAQVLPRVRALLGEDTPFELVWASVYTFACQRMAAFRHGRLLFAGDAAHGVSPFGARGANSGVQDAENLGWKLAAVLQGRAPDALLDSYAAEREQAADENILHSTRATDFITPKSEISRLFRDAVLALARDHGFARTLVNSGRLSTPTALHGSRLNTCGDDETPRLRPGAPAVDAPVIRPDGRRGWLLRALGEDFTALLAAGAGSAALAAALREVVAGGIALEVVVVGAAIGEQGATLVDADGLVAQRYALQPGGLVLLRPDRHVCARWVRPGADDVLRAVHHALALA